MSRETPEKLWKKLIPRVLEAYHSQKMASVPFLMSSHLPNFKSKVVNTDSRGLREGVRFPDQPMSNAIFGGSTVFGVGADSDEHTISSFLATKRRENWKNCGVRGYSGFQELLLFQSNIDQFSSLKKVVIVSGINDLHANVLGSSDHYIGPFYQELDFYARFYNRTRVHMPWRMIEKLYGIRNGHSPWLRNVPTKTLLRGIWEGRKSAFVKGVEIQYKNSLFNHYPSLEEQINRNLFLWKNLSKGMGFDVHFFLQPWSCWTGKELCPEEKELFDALDEIADDSWPIFTNQINKKETQHRCTAMFRKLCDKHSIFFIDLNERFKDYSDKDWLFIDRVHLTNLGNEKLAEVINESIG